MKKLLLFASVIILTIITLSSCSKDKDYSLSGTKCEYYPDSDVTYVFEFDTYNCTMCLEMYGRLYGSYIFTYQLDYPKVMIYAKEKGISDLEGTINGERMTVLNVSKKTVIGTFKKQ